MSTILAFVTAAVLILVSMFRRKQERPAPQQVLVKRYVHPGHTWAREISDGHIVIGIDEFAQSLLGAVHDLKLPRLLKHVHQGAGTMEVWHGSRRVRFVSPVTGWVVERNEMVLNNPSLVNSAPYGDGWLIKVKPSRFSPERANLLTGRSVVQWNDLVREQLRRLFAATPALLMQDGGVMVESLAERCSDEEWKSICKDFFLYEEHPKQS
jgi:glycine cleavage system H protein